MELIDTDIFEEEIIALEAKIANFTDEQNLIAFYGSSSIRLWSTLADDLQPLNVINLGFGGSSYPFCVHYFERVFKNITPSRIVLYAGDNDLGVGHKPLQVFNNFKRLIKKIQNQFGKIPIHVISIKPSPSRADFLPKTSVTNELMREFILCQPNGHWIEIFGKMLTHDAKTRPELYIEDMLHLNDHGYDIWRKEVRQHLIAFNNSTN